MGLFERYLTVWVGLGILAGVGLGLLTPASFAAIAAIEFAHVNLIVAVLIWIMIYPMMIQIDFAAVRDVGKAREVVGPDMPITTNAEEVVRRPDIDIVVELIGGGLIGVLVGLGTHWLLPRLALPAVGLYPIAVLTPIVAAYGIADLLHVSGFIAVYLSAVIVGSSSSIAKPLNGA